MIRSIFKVVLCLFALLPLVSRVSYAQFQNDTPKATRFMTPITRYYAAAQSNDSTSVHHSSEYDTMLRAVPLEFLGGASLFTALYFAAGGNRTYGINNSNSYLFSFLYVIALPAAEALLISTIGDALTDRSSTGWPIYAVSYVVELGGISLLPISKMSRASYFGTFLGLAVLPSLLFYFFVHSPPNE